MMPFTTATLTIKGLMPWTEDIERLTSKTDSRRAIAVHYDRAHDELCKANLDHCAIHVRPLLLVGDYAAALHEIGHLREPKARNSHSRVAQECYAWQWAISHAAEWSEPMTQYLAHCLTAYADLYWPHGQQELINATIKMAVEKQK